MMNVYKSMSDLEAARDMLATLRGYAIPRITYAQSASNTLSNRDVNMDVADDWIDALDDIDDSQLLIESVSEGESMDVAAEADNNAALGNGRDAYAGYEWIKITIDVPASGCIAGVITELYVPRGGW